LHFEEYLIREGAPENVAEIDLAAANTAAPGPNVIPSILEAEAIFVCPSNPVVSIGPILALSGVREALRQARAPIIAVSPIIGGAPVKGPADRLLKAIGTEVSSLGVAKLYSDFCKGMIFDEQDIDQLNAITALGYKASVLDTLMVDQVRSEAVALAALSLVENLR
jgi:LPPG:FO 2-phospho-L-lactate transferase